MYFDLPPQSFEEFLLVQSGFGLEGGHHGSFWLKKKNDILWILQNFSKLKTYRYCIPQFGPYRDLRIGFDHVLLLV